MSLLAEPIEYTSPPAAFLNAIPDRSYNFKQALWFGLSPDTRKVYQAAVKSYEYFCYTKTISPWPASLFGLEEWVTQRLFGSSIKLLSQLKPDTILSYLSALRSYHVDRNLSTGAFDNPRLDRIIRGGKRLFPYVKALRYPISQSMLERITSTAIDNQNPDINDLNVNTAFLVAWAGFLRMGEFTYSKAELQDILLFERTRLTRNDISFSDDGQCATLRLKRSKTDVNHSGVQIILAATSHVTCPVRALRLLFELDPQSPNAPLFRFREGAFSRDRVLKFLTKRLELAQYGPLHYSGHSFRKGAAQHASDHGMPHESIQQLGRWTSNAFQLYFKTSPFTLYNLNLRFQTGRQPTFPSGYHFPSSSSVPH